MALTVTSPSEYSAAYNPVIVQAVSDVRDDFTIGDIMVVTDISSSSGFAKITIDNIGSFVFLQGDYVLLTSLPGSESIEGVALITSVIDIDNFVINKPFITGLSSNGSLYKYISNYSMLLKFYVYITTAPSTAVLVATKTLKPKFLSGYCVFYSDLSGLIQSYNYEGTTTDDVLSSDLYVATEAVQVDKKSFVKYGFECFEAFDNPVGGTPVYQQEVVA
jgi:hypothetical protein